MKNKSRHHVLADFPKGEYYLGDLCYVLNDAQWNEILKQCIDPKTHQCYDGEFIVDGQKIFMASTGYGDGTYKDNFEENYDVDSGSIGICPISLCSKEKIDVIKKHDLGQILPMQDDFVIDADHGYFEIFINDNSYLIIDTKEDKEEKDYEDNSW